MVHLKTHLRFSYCSLHEEAGTAVKKVKIQLDVVLKNLKMNALNFNLSLC